jgi:RimJ/RimL family protein N-acetyltransferase
MDRLFFDLRQRTFSLSARLDVPAVQFNRRGFAPAPTGEAFGMTVSPKDASNPGTLPSEMTDTKVRLRRAGPQDVEYLLTLEIEPDVAPFLSAGRAASREELLEEVERSLVEPAAFGRLLIETPFEREWRLVGAIGFERTNKRSRIARIGGLAIHPDFRGRGLGKAAVRELAKVLFGSLDYHRLEAGVYGFNQRGAAAIESAGFVREGVKRRAYRPHGEWVDAVEFGLIVEELDAGT